MSQAGSNSSGGGGGGSGIQNIAGNTGTATGTTVNLVAPNAGANVAFTASGDTVDFAVSNSNNNLFLGQDSGSSSTAGLWNTSIGDQTLSSLSDADNNVGNTAIGAQALQMAQTSTENTAVGWFSLNGLIEGVGGNVAVGAETLSNIVDGQYNTVIGPFAGQNLTGSDSNNVCLASSGILGDTFTFRVGDSTGSSVQGDINAAYIQGIFGKSIGVSGIAVSIDNAGKLGTTVSSEKFKENIKDIESEISSKIHDLRPVVFNYIADETKSLVYGLIAEEVEKIFPGMVSKDKDGNLVSVKYQDLPILLLNELIKLKKDFEDFKANK